MKRSKPASASGFPSKKRASGSAASGGPKKPYVKKDGGGKKPYGKGKDGGKKPAQHDRPTNSSVARIVAVNNKESDKPYNGKAAGAAPGPHDALITELNKLWNKMRESKLSDEERAPVLAKAIAALTVDDDAHMRLSLKHDSARLVQAVLKLGSDEQTKALVQRFAKTPADRLRDLFDKPYARHVALALIQKASTYKEPGLVRPFALSMRGRVGRMAVHVHSSEVLDACLHKLPAKYTAAVRAELLQAPPHAVLLPPPGAAGTDKANVGGPPTALADALAAHSDPKARGEALERVGVRCGAAFRARCPARFEKTNQKQTSAPRVTNNKESHYPHAQ